jgi:hypothetical protein
MDCIPQGLNSYYGYECVEMFGVMHATPPEFGINIRRYHTVEISCKILKNQAGTYELLPEATLCYKIQMFLTEHRCIFNLEFAVKVLLDKRLVILLSFLLI